MAGYVKEADNLKDHGIGELVCISVNDAFVMGAWAKDTQAEGKVGICYFPKFLQYFPLFILWLDSSVHITNRSEKTPHLAYC